MLLQQRYLPKLEGVDGTWTQQRHGLYANKDFGRVGRGPVAGTLDFLEQSIILECIDNVSEQKLITVELGAGWGRQTLRIAGYCKTVQRQVETYAFEAEPSHHKWLSETLKYNDISATTIYGAVADKLGWTNFTANLEPTDNYGQSIKATGNLQVPTFTLSWLFETFKLPRIHILHMDIQGTETLAIQGGLDYLHRIDNVIIGIHSDKHISAIVKLFAKHSPEHSVLLTLPKKAGLCNVAGFEKPITITADGILFLSKALK